MVSQVKVEDIEIDSSHYYEEASAIDGANVTFERKQSADQSSQPVGQSDYSSYQDYQSSYPYPTLTPPIDYMENRNAVYY